MSDPGNDLGIGIAGLGFMGRTHLESHRKAERSGCAVRVAAVCDQDAGRFEATDAGGNLGTGQAALDLDGVHKHTAFQALLDDADVDAISLCTHTDTHVDLAIQALEAGKHVLVEKPVATRAAEAERLAAVARSSERVCMPAMCLRFWPGWSWLAEHVRAGTFGAPLSAVFRRLGSAPGWSAFYADTEKSGGALFDLHVHDADFVRHAFGAPAAVHAHGTRTHVTAAYRFATGPPHVTAEGAWDQAPGLPFHMSYTVSFEEASLSYELGRTPTLRLAVGEACEEVALDHATGYDHEVRHFAAACRGEVELQATVEESVGLTRMLEAEARSLETGTEVELEGVR